MENTFLPDPKKEEEKRREKIVNDFENTFSGIPEEEEKRTKERLTERSKQYIANYSQRLNKEIELYEISEIEFLNSEIEFYKNIVSDFIGYGILDRPGTYTNPYDVNYSYQASSELNDYLVAEYLYLKLGSKLFINRQQRKLDFLNKQKGQIWITFDSPENEVTQHEPPPEIQENKGRVIIQWNEQKNVLTDLFRQLKTITNKNNEPIVTNSIPEIAIFLKENFSCYQNTKLDTIQTKLKNSKFEEHTPKAGRRIILEKE